MLILPVFRAIYFDFNWFTSMISEFFASLKFSIVFAPSFKLVSILFPLLYFGKRLNRFKFVVFVKTSLFLKLISLTLLFVLFLVLMSLFQVFLVFDILYIPYYDLILNLINYSLAAYLILSVLPSLLSKFFVIFLPVFLKLNIILTLTHKSLHNLFLIFIANFPIFIYILLYILLFLFNRYQLYFLTDIFTNISNYSKEKNHMAIYINIIR